MTLKPPRGTTRKLAELHERATTTYLNEDLFEMRGEECPDYLRTPYAVIVEKEPDSEWGVWCPDVPGCTATGSTRDEALKAMSEALGGHLKLMREQGKDIPRALWPRTVVGRYPIVVERTESGTYSAYVPELPGCISVGDTRAELVEMMREAVALHLEAMREDDEEIPEPGASMVRIEVAW